MNANAILSEPLVPSRLKSLWADADKGLLTKDEAYQRQQQWIGDYAAVWADALLLPGETDLKHSLCRELARLEGNQDLAAIEQQCRNAVHQMKEDWEACFEKDNPQSVVKYYDQSAHYIYELMWWHTLQEDNSPLAYVTALHLALQHGCKDSLDFGAGVGSGGVLFARHGLSIALADISSTLLNFSKRRLEARGLSATYLDLKTTPIPHESCDFITAMDVFEHIAQPENHIDPLAFALRPGGILFGRFSAEPDDDRPSHIARDFAPMFARLDQLGFKECWKDDWLWGHQAFRKP